MSNGKPKPSKSTLYVIPNTLGGREAIQTIPAYVLPVIQSLSHFIVENEKTVRRFFRALDPDFPIDNVNFYPLNKHSSDEDLMQYLMMLLNGQDVGLVSEAGMPGIADPGSEIIQLAHQNNIKVKPLSGPSSITLAVAASGMNGQNFIFHGYLPIKQYERVKKLRELEQASRRLGQTQIFIETPFRNLQLLQDILANCHINTELCIAADLTLPSEFIATKAVSEWKKKAPNIQKRPVVFLLMSR